MRYFPPVGLQTQEDGIGKPFIVPLLATDTLLCIVTVQKTFGGLPKADFILKLHLPSITLTV